MRYLICKPRGGLNDILCQIYKCLKYSHQHNRYLYIDGLRSGFLDDLSKYFEFTDDVSGQMSVSVNDYNMLNSLQAFPNALTSNLDEYRDRYVHKEKRKKWWKKVVKGSHVENIMGEVLSFDFRLDYQEDVLLHESQGGGRNSIQALRSIRVTEAVAQIISTFIQYIPKPYYSIHVRSSDPSLQCDYVNFFKNIELDLSIKNIFLSCDQRKVQDFGKIALNSHNVITFSDLPTGVVTLHNNQKLPRWETNIHALVDLVSMAASHKIISAQTFRGSQRFNSGFFCLAENLNEYQEILTSFTRNSVIL